MNGIAIIANGAPEGLSIPSGIDTSLLRRDRRYLASPRWKSEIFDGVKASERRVIRAVCG